MGTIEVLSKRNFTGDGVYIGRPGVFGNPFKIGPDGDRKDVIEKYRKWLPEELSKNQALREALEELAKRVAGGEHLKLICWCAPLPCHGDALAEAILKRARDRSRD